MNKSVRDSALFLAPFTLIFVIFLLFPAVYSIYLSFRKASIYSDLTRIFSSMTYVGLSNYKAILSDKDFLWSLLMTFYYAILTIPSGLFLSLTLAVALSNKLPGARIFRSAYFLPNILDLFVIALVWTAIYAPKLGVIDQIFKFLNVSALFDKGILADPWWAMPGVALTVILKGSGFGMILYLAAIQNIPSDIYEAADIDGANFWQKFIHITVPLVKHVTLLLFVTGILGSLMAFSEIYALTGGRPFETLGDDIPFFHGTTQGTTKIAGFYLFERFYLSQDYGYAAAISVVLLLISLPLSILSFFVLRSDGPTLGQLARRAWAKIRGKKAAA